MFIDLTLRMTPKMRSDAEGNLLKANFGHLGTHFDVMNKVFPLDYLRREALVFDVSHVQGREIDCSDIDLSMVKKELFIAFHTGFMNQYEYGTKEYFTCHPELSKALISALIEKGVSIIGVDCAGVRRGKEHTPTDQYCADHGVFIVENLCHLEKVIGNCVIYTFPMNFADMSGLPCRVAAEVMDERH